MWRHRQRGLLCHLPADRRLAGGPGHREQEARLLRGLVYPDGTVAVDAWVEGRLLSRLPLILVDPVVVQVLGFRLHGVHHHPLVWPGSGFVEDGRLGGRPSVVMRRLVLVNSGLLSRDLFHGAVVLRRLTDLDPVVQFLPSAF